MKLLTTMVNFSRMVTTCSNSTADRRTACTQ
jgi:hypothetical protein